MVDVRGDVLRPPHDTTPAAVKANKNHKPHQSVLKILNGNTILTSTKGHNSVEN